MRHGKKINHLGRTASHRSARTAFSYLKDKDAVKELFTVVGEKVANRPGGYTRILKTGNRAGDNAEMAMIELVDFNEFFDGFGQDKKKATTRRSRRGGSSAAKAEAPAAKATAPVIEDAVVEEVVEEASVAEVTPAAVEATEVVESDDVAADNTDAVEGEEKADDNA